MQKNLTHVTNQAQKPCCHLSEEGSVLLQGTYYAFCQSKSFCINSGMNNVHREWAADSWKGKVSLVVILKQVSATSNFNTG